MKLSIVVPAYNEEGTIPSLFASLARQTYRDFEVIVADAFSKDATREICQTAGALVVDGGMPGPGRNRGALRATGEVVLFLDADVVLPHERWLFVCMSEFEKRALDVATCDITPMSDRASDKLFTWVYNRYTRLTRPLLAHAPGFCIFVRRTMHERIKGFDETVVFAEDHDYVQRAVRGGARFRFLDGESIPMDVRRFDRDGRVVTAIRFMLAEVYMILFGGIRTDLFKYRFGHMKKN